MFQGALRRESAAQEELRVLKTRLADMASLVDSKDKDAQRLNMIIRLR